MATDLLVTPSDIEAWAQLGAGSLENDTLAIRICAGISMLVREAGDPEWTAATVPPRAKLIADIAAKNYYTNPTALISEGTGPLSERKLDEAVHNMRLSDTERQIIAALAGVPDPTQPAGGLWIQPIARDDALLNAGLDDDFYVTDQSGSDWMIPWVRQGDSLYPREL